MPRPTRTAAGFIAECRHVGDSEAAIETAEKQGYDTGLRFFTRSRPAAPADLDRELLLMDYGTGAIFGCPAHDQRDLDFVRVYDLPGRPRGLPPDEDPAKFTIDEEAYVGDGLIDQFALPQRDDDRSG